MTQKRLDGTGISVAAGSTITMLDNIYRSEDGTVRVHGPRSQAVDTLDCRVRTLEAENARLQARNARPGLGDHRGARRAPAAGG